jgi:spore germination cell wall hydrolase CwlJ-like protein
MKYILLVICLSILSPLMVDGKVPTFKYTKAEIECVVRNVYFEARGEPTAGMKAVIAVVVNRASKTKQSLCEVVYSKAQFSWTLKGANKPVPEEARLAIGAVVWDTLAETDGVANGLPDASKGATFYHSVKIKKPKWTKGLQVSVIIGNHIFYKETKWNTQRVNTSESS